MKLIILLFPALLFMSGNAYKIDFGKSATKTNSWVVLSDNVMGGRSESQIEYSSNTVILTGNVSLRNRGGFVSIRSDFKNQDLSSYKTVKITFRASGQKYAFTLENSGRWYEPAYKHEFSAKETNKWETVSLDLGNFSEEVIGQPTGKKVSKSILENILRIGIATTEKKEGPFQIEIESIEFS